MTTLLIDATNLCHRAYHTTGKLSHENAPTGVAFGIIRDVENLTELFQANRVVWAFDKGVSKRKEIYPGYKAKRHAKPMSDDEKKDRELFNEQMNKLRDDLLPRMGYNNVFHFDGYEADDIIAQACPNSDGFVSSTLDFIIISSDKDLWQCLKPCVSWHNPISKKTMTYMGFRAEWKLTPEFWVHIKAYAGCTSDEIEGIKGVGEKTAANYLCGHTKIGSRINQLIESPQGQAIKQRNVKLVSLPFPGLPHFTLVDDEVTESKRNRIKEELGIRPKRAAAKSGGFQF